MIDLSTTEAIVLGVIVGSLGTTFVLSLCRVAGDADRLAEAYQRGRLDERGRMLRGVVTLRDPDGDVIAQHAESHGPRHHQQGV